MSSETHTNTLVQDYETAYREAMGALDKLYNAGLALQGRLAADKEQSASADVRSDSAASGEATGHDHDGGEGNDQEGN